MKQTNLFIVFLVIVLGMFTNLIADTVTIGSGTSTTQYLPLYTNYGYTYSQQIYTPAQINTAGSIQKIRFYKNSGSTSNSSAWVVYMGHTSQTSFSTSSSWIPLSSLTEVFNGSVTIPSTEGWVEITLTNPFAYNNSENLVVAVDENTSGYGTTVYWRQFTSSSNSSIYYYSDGTNPNPASPPTASARQSYVNQIQLEFPSTTPPNPAINPSPADDAVQVGLNPTLTWSSGGGGPTSYDVYFGTSENPDFIGNQAGASYSPGTLVRDREYFWKIVPWNTNGPAEDCPVWSFTTIPEGLALIGEGTSSTLNLPINPYYGYNYSQTLYLQSEIDIAERRIEKLYYYWNGIVAGTNSANWSIFMGHTDKTAFSSTTDWVPNGNLSPVYSGSVTLPATAGWVEITLTSPFIYNNRDNLVIAVNETTPGDDGMNVKFLGTTTATNRGLRVQKDASPAYDPSSPGTGTLVAGFANIKLLFGDLPSAPALGYSPESWNYGLVVLGRTASKQFTLSNTGSGNLDIGGLYIDGEHFEITSELGMNTLEAGQSTNFTVTYNPQAEGNHTANIVIEDNRAQTMIPLSGSCEDTTVYFDDLPYAESFDNVTAPALPLGWTAIVNSTSGYAYVNNSTTSPYSSPNNAYLYNSGDTAAMLILVTPKIDVPISSLRLKFYALGGTSYTLHVGTMTDPTDAGTFTQFTSVSPTSTYAQYIVSLADYQGSDQYIAFRHGLGGTYRNIYIDNVMIEIPEPQPPNPVTLVFPTDNLTTFNNPRLSWTPAILGEPTTKYNVYINDNLVAEDITSTFYQTSGLSAGETYTWRVEPGNVNGYNSDAETRNFQTVTTGNLAEDFEIAVPPTGWQNPGSWSRSSSAYITGAYSASKYTTSTVTRLVTPLLDIRSGDRLEFFARTTATSTYQRLQVQYSANGTDWSDLEAPISLPSNSPFAFYSYDLSSLASKGDYYLAIGAYYATGGSGGYIYVDHMMGPNIKPLAPNPVTLGSPSNAATNQSTKPTLSWTAASTGGIPTGFKVYCDQNADPVTLIDTVTSSPYTFTTSLEYSRTYYWKVVATNSVGDSQGNTIRSFTVMADPTRPLPYLETFNASTSMPANWTTSGFSVSSTHGVSSNGLYVNLWSSTTSANAVTPPVGPITNNTLLEFDYRFMAYSGYPNTALELTEGNKLDVQVSSDNGTTYETIYTVDISNHTTSTAFAKISIPLTQAKALNANDIIKVKFLGTWASGDFYLDIDNVSFKHVAQEAVFAVDPTTKNFGTVNVGSTASQIFTISNQGLSPLTINSVALTGDMDQFSLTDANSYPAVLDAYQTMQVTVRFAPISENTFNATLTINDDLSAKVARTVTISGTGSDALNYGGGDAESVAGGYYFANNLSVGALTVPAFSWVNATTNELTDQNLASGSTDDGYWGPIPIGFNFLFYGNTYNELFISTNGTINFGTSATAFSNAAIPTAAVPNNMIALFWDDLEYFPGYSQVFYSGNASSLTITLQNLGRTGDYNPANSINTQAILYADGRIKLQYQDIIGSHTPTIGLENSTGTKGVQYHFNGVGGPYSSEAKAGIAVMFGDNPETLPVTLSSFTAVLTADLHVSIAWTAESETNHAGYNVLRNEVKDLSTALRINGGLIDQGNTSGSQVNYNFTDTEVYQQSTYYYWLESLSLAGEAEYYGPLMVTIETGGQEPGIPQIPTKTELLAAFPNPFNPTTNLRYSLKDAGLVRIEIYNTKGQLIRSLQRNHEQAGYYQMPWDGRDSNNRLVGTGVYFYRMSTSNYTAIKKMVLSK